MTWHIQAITETRDGLRVDFVRNGPDGLDIYMPEHISGIFTKWVTPNPPRPDDTP
jgi:hypothetical protein